MSVSIYPINIIETTITKMFSGFFTTYSKNLMVITFYMRSKLWPFKKAENPNPLTTDDKFLVEIGIHDNEKELQTLLKKSGALEVSIIEKSE